MARITVNASSSYDVFIDEVPLDGIGRLARSETAASSALIITDTNVAPLYAERVLRSLEDSGLKASLHVIEAGESSKTIQTYAECLKACCEAEMTRSDAVIALGGGVVGDVAGFTAATFMRGCSCIQVPTSLLACVDSSVGGKTAVDLPHGKNLAGCFYQPNAVLVDTSVLSTLDLHYFTDGCAEVIKYGVIADASLLQNLSDPLTPMDSRLSSVIERCIAIKRDIVSADEHEKGARQLLNFGHTMGHAIELLSGYSVSHGFAVACGMALCAHAALILGYTDERSYGMLLDALQAAHLPVSLADCGCASFTAEDIYQAALTDKKRHGETINVIVSPSAGTAEIKTMSLDEFARFIEIACEGDC